MRADQSGRLFALVQVAILPIVLGPAAALAGSHDATTAGVGLRADTRMAKGMDALHAEMNRLKAQMERIAQTTDPSARQKLIKEHLLNLRQTMTGLHAMALQMVEDVDKGRIVSDRDLANRQRMLADLAAMALDMLDEATRNEAASCR